MSSEHIDFSEDKLAEQILKLSSEGFSDKEILLQLQNSDPGSERMVEVMRFFSSGKKSIKPTEEIFSRVLSRIDNPTSLVTNSILIRLFIWRSSKGRLVFRFLRQMYVRVSHWIRVVWKFIRQAIYG